MPRSATAAVTLLTAGLAACGGGNGSSADGNGSSQSRPALQVPAYADAMKLGGDTTDINASRSSFGFSAPAANLDPAGLARHIEGDAAFEQAFVPFGEPGQERVDGLGPVFNNSSCNTCHQRDGRGTPPAAGDTFTELGQNESLLLAISVEDASGASCEPAFNTGYCAPQPVPDFGRQVFQRGVFDARPDSPFSGAADVFVRYESSTVTYADGSALTLRKPVLQVRNPYDNPGEAPSELQMPVSRVLQPDVRFSPRIGPPVFGLGLLEAIPEDELLAAADPVDADGDGVSGRANRVFDPLKAAAGDLHPVSLGRFGLKANNVTVFDQVSTAMVNDIGITNPLFPAENIAGTPLHDAYLARNPDDNGVGADGQPEAALESPELLSFYTQTLHVPARRNVGDADVRRGSAHFEAAGCSGCHTPRYVTGPHPEAIRALSNQEIYPFTDLLLHDMGEGLADNRADFQATGREWRTRPLWGIGLTQTVNPLAGFLHDGRARTLEEAVLWHGGEARAAREYFRNLPEAERSALLAFLRSL